jgi:uncharacterized repeat protein (TIGR03847 family)
MPAIVHGFDWPDRLVVGTIGEPGSRSFYLQARSGSRVVSVALEKEQSAVLAAKIEEILDELMADEGNPFGIPASTPVELIDNDPLDQPVQAEFRTGTMSLGWDPTTAQLVIEAYPLVDAVEDDEVEPQEMLLVRIPVGSARAFAKRTLEVVGAGRELCQNCGNPMDPEGHVCPVPGDRG